MLSIKVAFTRNIGPILDPWQRAIELNKCSKTG